MAPKAFKIQKPRSLERRLQMTKNNAGGIYSAVRYTLLCTRLLGLLPLSGLWCTTSDQLRFTIRSPYLIFYAASMFGQCLMFFMTFVWLLQNGISLRNVSNLFFFFSSLTSSLILLNITRNWPEVMVAAETIEVALPPLRNNVTKTCNITIGFVFMAALVEHIFSVAFGYTVAYSCSRGNVVETFFRTGMPWVFEYTTYSLWKGIIAEIFNFQSTFIWSFNDLLIMVLSIYLTEHLVIHNALLKKAVVQEHFTAIEFRIQYLNVVHLVRLINGQVGIYILTSFGSNLYWICTQLFNSLNKSENGHYSTCYDGNNLQNITQHETEHAVYFTFSLSFVVMRTLLVLLLASRIHSNSKIPLVYLYELPSEKFDVEVKRFIAQINNTKVALSGLDFFYVTRAMILTLLGTIVTYELVMLQFNKLPSTLDGNQKLDEM